MKLLISAKAGRCADGAERDRGSVLHAVPAGNWAALCGDKPGRHSGGWASEGVTGAATEPTCEACARVKDVLERMERAGGMIERWPGGFWTTTDADLSHVSHAGGTSHRVPKWYTGAHTLRAMAKRGLIVESCHQNNASGSFIVQYKIAEASC